MILHVVVAVEYIMLPVVLIFGGDNDLAKTQAELLTGVDPKVPLGIGVAAPGGVDLGQVLHRFPVALVQHRQDASPVSAGLAAKDAVEGGRPFTLTLGPSPREGPRAIRAAS